MSAADQFQRVATIAALVEKAPAPFGRTALMKCLYFLQTVKHVPLGYNFGLYTYGPFDSDVLNDLNLAERIGAIESKIFQTSGRQAYEFRITQGAGPIFARSAAFLSRYRQDLDWVIQEFGSRSAADLETMSTLVYVHRSTLERGDRMSISDLAKTVHAVKPHLDALAIERQAKNLKEKGLITALA